MGASFSPLWPLIGLALGTLGVLAARSNRDPWSGLAVMGVVLNALALCLALGLRLAG